MLVAAKYINNGDMIEHFDQVWVVMDSKIFEDEGIVYFSMQSTDRVLKTRIAMKLNDTVSLTTVATLKVDWKWAQGNLGRRDQITAYNAYRDAQRYNDNVPTLVGGA